MRRSEHSIRNSLTAIATQAISLLFGFVTRIVFVRVLGEAYLGINGVFYSVLSLLSLTELGMGSALTFALYKPLADDDRESVGRIMNLYALAYRIVALAVTLIGLCLIPFLPFFTADVPEVNHVTLIYLLFLVNSAASYLFSYKRSLITASQRDRINAVNLFLFSCLQNLLQLVLLLTTGSYLLYLAAQLVCTLLANLAISHTAGKLFPWLRGVHGLPGRDVMAPIVKNVKAMFCTRFGSVAVTGTDNLLIASVDVLLVGIYSNYLLVLQTVQTVLGQVITAVTASVGSLIAESEDESARRRVWGDIHFAASWLYGFSAIALDLLSTRFIVLAFGPDMELAAPIVHLMAFNFYLAGLRQPNLMFINAAGLFEPVKFKGFLEAAVNLAVSALFLWLGMGIYGVLLGTTVSHLVISFTWEPFCVGKYCLGRGIPGAYLLRTFLSTAAVLGAWALTAAVTAPLPSGIGGFLASAAITAILPNLIFLLIGHRSRSFAYFVSAGKRMLGRVTAK